MRVSAGRLPIAPDPGADGAVSHDLAFAAYQDLCPSSVTPTSLNHVDALSVGIDSAKGYDVKADLFGDPSLIFGTDCWLLVFDDDKGEIRYTSTSHGGQSMGGGSYLAADTAERASVVCARRRSGPLSPSSVRVTLTLVPR